MNNEIANVSVDLTDAPLAMGAGLLSMQADVKFIQPLKIGYGTSKCCKIQEMGGHVIPAPVKIGSFYVGEGDNAIDLGKTIKMLAVSYKYKIIAMEGNDWTDFLALAEGDVMFKDRPEYARFVQKNKDAKILDGVEILVYLPERNSYFSFLTNKTLKDSGVKIVGQSAGKYVVQATTIKKSFSKTEKGKKIEREWFELEVVRTTEVITPDDLSTIMDDPHRDKFLSYVDTMESMDAKEQEAANTTETGRER